MKVIFLTLIFFCFIFVNTCFAEVTLISPKDGDIVYLDCENEKLKFEWSSDIPNLTYSVVISTPENAINPYRWSSPIYIRAVCSGNYKWGINYIDRDLHLEKGRNNTLEPSDFTHTERKNFEVVCTNIDDGFEEEDIENYERQEIDKDVNLDTKVTDTEKEDVLVKNTIKENISKHIDKVKNIPKEVKSAIQQVFTNIKDIFTWNIEFKEINFDMFLPPNTETKEIEDTKEDLDIGRKKPFGFPFKKIIGVTQWYGNTVFQKPHTGIDFGATKEEIISPDDGIVVALGWDSFNGDCFSGGNYLVIKHTNGMHTAYFHIEKYFIKINQQIKRGDLIAISGNSGKWNCQNLKYHLHFETRTGRYQNTHVNPVDYIDIDWSKVPTLGYRSIPGRLSGENPHPSY